MTESTAPLTFSRCSHSGLATMASASITARDQKAGTQVKYHGNALEARVRFPRSTPEFHQTISRRYLLRLSSVALSVARDKPGSYILERAIRHNTPRVEPYKARTNPPQDFN